ncbi:uncharacterized protein LAESUDRAFT_199775 [Laetiporus sulphureus 93-53]|uniref:F-box domain-containing protein n=1 Tax=Laetiporus sulphureus 93-53 TaxID=1314785 RepID=A0A165E301_9APHY|nr:uncharacterized protein LAESUDRAFT_199775 [Laetiporus sulphureus 93-53]KZT06144.1 hypothetical protein LAESUDRAFT_199775 [Laetiporus sulphureus 93-53]
MSEPYLPYDLVYATLEHAWLSCRDVTARWTLYETLSCVSKQCRDDIFSVILRHVILETTLDCTRYSNIRRYHFDDYAENAPQSHIIINVDLLKLANTASRPEDLNDEAAEAQPENTYKRIIDLAPRCESVTAVFPNNSPGHIDIESLLSFLRFIHQIQTVTFVSISSNWPTYLHLAIPLQVIPSPAIRHLRLGQYPLSQDLPAGASDHDRLHTFPRNFLANFPNLRVLHIETPTLLKDLLFLDTLEVLVLDACPWHAPLPSMVGWNVGSALKRGLLRRPDDTFPARRIVVRTGPALPPGWTQVQAACVSHGVILERRIAFRSWGRTGT